MNQSLRNDVAIRTNVQKFTFTLFYSYLDFKTSQPYNSFILFIKTIYQQRKKVSGEILYDFNQCSSKY